MTVIIFVNDSVIALVNDFFLILVKGSAHCNGSK